MNQKVKQILHDLDTVKLPSLPHVLLKLLDICHEKSPSFSELANLLKLDPGMYARVFSVCFRNQCSKANQPQTEPAPPLEQALQHLGINTIKSIVVTATVQQFFSRVNLERTDFLKQHWQHSCYCASLAQSIAEHCKYTDPDEAYTTGLLQDIGQLVLEAAYPDKYIAASTRFSEDEYFRTLEQNEFGATHQQIGAQLLKKYGANGFIYDAVLYHHEATDQIIDAHPLVKILNLANMLTSSSFKKENQQGFVAAKELLDLDKPLLLEIQEKFRERINHTAKSLEITLTVDGMNGAAVKKKNAEDELKQVQLAEQVRNIALLDSLRQHLSRSTYQSDSQRALLSIISQHVGILFGINQSILFLYDEISDRVHAVAADDQLQQLADISIPLIADRSLVTDALINKQANHSFDSNLRELSIIDRQLINFTEQDGIICLPMIISNAAVGALILGVNKTQYKNLRKQFPLLMRFVNEVALTISEHYSTTKLPANDNNSRQLEQKNHEVLHEVRNSLTIMNNYLDILSYKLENDKSSQEDVKTIKSEIEQINYILNPLADPEKSTKETSAVNINSIIVELTKVFQTSLFANKDIQITLDLDERIDALQSNANALKQIYTNLIKNSAEALHANGQLMVYTRDFVNVDGKQHIELSVADDGPGIDTDILRQLFSPVKSTKGGDHTGLGLAIVKKLTNELHGTISCRSSNKGTSFNILFPK